MEEFCLISKIDYFVFNDVSKNIVRLIICMIYIGCSYFFVCSILYMNFVLVVKESNKDCSMK